jgi:hypothetical protein
MHFADEVSLAYSAGFLSCRKILHGADVVTSTPKEDLVQIFIALKNPLSSVGFEPANLGSNGKHDNY